jgi:hypothetical protein
MSLPEVAIHRVARPSLGKPVVSPLCQSSGEHQLPLWVELTRSPCRREWLLFAHLRRRSNVSNRRIADVANRGLRRLSWAVSAPTGVALGKDRCRHHSRHSIASAKRASPPKAEDPAAHRGLLRPNRIPTTSFLQFDPANGTLDSIDIALHGSASWTTNADFCSDVVIFAQYSYCDSKFFN